jgi:low affinity Fe/Cu permease
MAMACFRLVTFFPELPDRSVPRLRSCIARSTFFEASVPYRFLATWGLLPRSVCKIRTGPRGAVGDGTSVAMLAYGAAMKSQSAKKGRAAASGASPVSEWLARFSHRATQWAGGSWAFAVAVFAILVWAATGPLFHYSDTWQLVINTGTTVVTFLMVFLIQRSQNKESKAVQLKLNEIVAAIRGASNRLIDVESLSESEIEVLRKHYGEIARLAEKDKSVLESHSIEEARERHEAKRRG